MEGYPEVRMTQKGHGISGRIYFQAEFDEDPSNKVLAALQTWHGYHPMGYDGPWRVSTEVDADGRCRVTWCCSASCD